MYHSFGAASTHCWFLTKSDASPSKLPLTPTMYHRLQPPCGKGTVSIRRWPAWLVRAPWASGVLDSARTAWDVRPASTDLPHPAVAVTAAQRASHRRPIAAFCPTQRLPGVRLPGTRRVKPLVSAAFDGVSEGIRTPDTQDHNNVATGKRPWKIPVFLGFLVQR